MDLENQSTLLEIDIDVDSLNAGAALAKQKVQDLSDALKILKATGKENTAEFVKTSGELKVYRAQVAEAVQVNSQLIKAQNDATGSIVEMRTNLSLITREYNSLSAAERSNEEIGGRLLAQQRALSDELKNLEQAGGNYTRDVGNYAKANGGFASSLKDVVAQQVPFVSSLSEAASTFNSLSEGVEGGSTSLGKFKTALAATGIGLILLLFSALIDYLKTFDPLMDAIEQGLAGFKAAFATLGRVLTETITSFTSVGDAISKIGSFLKNPIQGFKDLGSAMASAARDAAKLKAAQQDLEDTVRLNEVKTAETQQRVAELILKARNRSIDNVTRKKLLDEAAELDKQDFTRRTAQAQTELNQAAELAQNRAGLSKAQTDRLKREGIEYGLQLQQRGKLNDDEITALKKAQLAIIAVRQESTGRQEKIQNKIDADAEKAQAAEEKRAAASEKLREKLDKANSEYLESRARVDAISSTGRQAELDKINQDFQKRIDAAKGYSKLIQQLEIEQQATLAKQRKAFAEQDTKDDAVLTQTLYANQIKALKQHADEIKKENANISADAQKDAEESLRKAFDLQQQADATAYQTSLANQDLTELQKAEVDAIYKQQQLDRTAEYNTNLDALEEDLTNRRIAREQKEKDAVEVFEKAKTDAKNQGLGLLQQIFSKQTILGKAAFLAQKALAVSEIFIQTQKQVAAIQLAAAYQSASAAITIPFPLSIAAIAGIQAAAVGKTVLAEITGGIQIASVLAQAVAGFAKGGVFKTDGLGGAVRGPGSGTSDSVNARLSNGEAVMTARAVSMFGPQLSMMNVAAGGRRFDSINMSSGYDDGGVFGPAYSLSNDSQSIQRIIQSTAEQIAAAIPQQVLIIEEVQAKLNDKAYIATKSNI